MFDLWIGSKDWVCDDPAYTDPEYNYDEEEEEDEEDEKFI